MKIVVVTHSAEKVKDLAVLQQRYDIEIVAPTDALGACDLAVFDADIGEKIFSAQPSCAWMIINQTAVHRSLKSIQRGASGILGQNYGREAFCDCIESIRAGDIYIEPQLLQVLAMRQIRKLLSPFSELSSREFDVFCLLAEDCGMAYIAENLGISTKTAFNCQTQIKNKLGLRDQRQMHGFARKHGLI